VADAFPRLQRSWADQGYTGGLPPPWTAQERGVLLEVVYPTSRPLQRYAPDIVSDLGQGPGFCVLPKCGIVELAFSWIGRQRRMSKDYERLASSSEAVISLVGSRLLIASLALGVRSRYNGLCCEGVVQGAQRLISSCPTTTQCVRRSAQRMVGPLGSARS
jgi:hypothetical protein